MSNELDLSAFDEPTEAPKTEAAPALDLSAFDDSEPSRAPSNTEAPVAESDLSDKAMGAGIGGAVGAAAGGALGGIAKLGANAVGMGISKAGALTPDQMGLITSDVDAYKASRPTETLLEGIKTNAQDVVNSRKGAGNLYTNILKGAAEDADKVGYDSAEAAKNALTDAPVSKQAYYESLLSGLKKNDGTLIPVKQETKDAFFAENAEKPFSAQKEGLSKMEPSQRLQYLQANAKDMEQFKGSEVYDRFQKELALAQQGAQDAENTLKTNIYTDATNKYQQKLNLPKEILGASPDAQNLQLNPEYKKVVEGAVARARDTLNPDLTQQQLGGKTGIIPGLRESANFGGQPGPGERVATDMSESVRELLGKENPEYDSQMKRSSAAINASDDLQGAKVRVGDDGVSRVTKANANSIKKTLANPEEYADEYKQLQKGIESAKPFTERLPAELMNDPETGLQARVAQANSIEKKLKDFGVKVDPVTGEVDVDQSTYNKIKRVSQEGTPQELKKLEDLLQEASKLSSERDAKGGADLLAEIKRSGIKDIVKGGGEVSTAATNNAIRTGSKALTAATLGGVPAAVASIAKDKYGTKAQELLAKYRGSNTGKFLNRMVDNAPGGAALGLGVMGSLIGAANAASDETPADERLTPTVAVGAGIADAVNPIPGTDIVNGVQQGQKQAIEAARGFEAPVDPYGMDLGAAPGSEATLSNPVVQSAVKGFAEGAVAPLTGLAKAAPAALEAYGEQASTDARSRMEKRFKAIDSFNKAPDKLPTQSKELSNSSAPQLQELADTFKGTPGAEAFVAPLEKAAQSKDSQSKTAALFALYQQPAFRQILNKNKKN